MQPALAPAPHPGMQTSAQDHADQVLHDQLLAAQQHLTAHQQQQQQQQPPSRPHPPATQPTHVPPNTASPRDQHNIDPAIAGASMLGPTPEIPQPESPSDDGKGYGKRPLSSSKRAAQNRAAQRAFRQRKETYIRKLEEQVKHFESIQDNYKALQSENYQLREYVINLQSRLLDSQGEVPELPANIDLSQTRPDVPVPPTSGTVPTPANPSSAAAPPSVATQQATGPQNPTPGGNDDLNSLNRIAVAGLGMRKHPNEEANYLNNFQAQAKRPRNEGSQNDPSDAIKTEQTNGLTGA